MFPSERVWLGQSQQSRAAYDLATDLAGNTGESAYLTRRRDQRLVSTGGARIVLHKAVASCLSFYL